MKAAAQYAALSKRAIVNTIRQPTSVIPSIVFPLVFMTMSSAALGRSTNLPGFPEVDSFVQFLVTATIVQGVLFGAVAAGTDMARDIEDGFFERLIASPVARVSILVGRVTGAALLGFCQAWIFLGVVSLFGVPVEGGIFGMFLVAIVAGVLAAAIGSLSMAMGLRTGSAEAVQGSFPLLFALMFLSSAFFPRDLMSGWFKAVATYNPLSLLIEGLRTQVISGIDVGEWGTSLLVAATIFGFGLFIAGKALAGRIRAAHH